MVNGYVHRYDVYLQVLALQVYYSDERRSVLYHADVA
jgi:hypothetical protein